MVIPRFFYLLLLSFITVKSKPNILLIVVDDLRPALGVYGDKNSLTPNIDKLASKSFVFKNAYAQQALCAPSRNSFLTSRRPDSLHLYDFYSYWRDTVGNFTTLPQFFKENGYHTYSIGKVFHPGISSNFSDDFPYSWSEIPFHPSTEKYKNSKVCVSSNGNLARNLICPVVVQEQPEGVLPDQQSFKAAVKYLKSKQNSTNPFFLAVGFHKPHVPFKFPEHYLNYHPLEKIHIPKNNFKPPLLPNVAWNPWIDVRQRDDIKKLNITFPFGKMPDNITLKIIQSYHASVTYVDNLVGKLLTKVDNKNTIVVLLGDHGWSMGEHGEFSKFSNFKIATRVPLIIRVPKLNEGQIECHNLVELVDLFPTFADLAGLDSLQVCSENKIEKVCTEGRSLVPLMVSAVVKKRYDGKRAIFYQYPRPGAFPTLFPNSDRPKLQEIKIMGYSVITEQFRYSLWVEFNNKNFTPNWNNIFGRELYDHSFDSEENINLAGRDDLDVIEKKFKKMLIKGWRN